MTQPRPTAEIASPPWKAPHPRELPEWRAHMHEYTGSMHNMTALSSAINAGQTAVLPMVPGLDASPGAIASQLLARSEQHRLREAHLYYASADMTSLALAAAATPPTEPIKQTRLPSPYGFMMFAEPIGGYNQDMGDILADTPMGRAGTHAVVTTPIVAVSWGLWTPSDIDVTDGPQVRWYNHFDETLIPIPQTFDGVWLTFYAPQGTGFDALPPDTIVASFADGSPMTVGDIQSHPAQAPLNWDNETALAFGAEFGEPESDTTKQWAQVVYTAWQLMGQSGKTQLTEVEEIPRDRPGRKRDRRDGITGHSDVRIVNVHSAHRPSRNATEQDASESTGRRAPAWSCRWPVRPYRRNTCLNPRAHAGGSCEHEDRIVPAHIKGPHGKPLKIGDTVNLWDHQPEETAP